VSSFNLHGSLLVQSMLRFSRPDVVVNSLLSLTAAELQAVCCDSAGSHVVTAFVNSETVTRRSELYTQLQVIHCHCRTVSLSLSVLLRGVYSDTTQLS